MIRWRRVITETQPQPHHDENVETRRPVAVEVFKFTRTLTCVEYMGDERLYQDAEFYGDWKL